MKRAATIAIAVVGVLELAAAIYVIEHNDAPKNSAAHSSQLPATQSASPSLSIDATSETRPAANENPIVAFLGDDWTAGTGASRKAKRFTTIVCANLGATERNFGEDGTGYAKSGPSAGPYRTQVERIAAAHPAVVVVSGGRNDRFDDAATAAEQAAKLFSALHNKLPEAQLIAIAPFWGDSDLPEELATLADAIRAAVTDAGGTYLDMSDPIHGHPEWMADEADPNDDGYASIAAALEPQLAPLLPH